MNTYLLRSAIVSVFPSELYSALTNIPAKWWKHVVEGIITLFPSLLFVTPKTNRAGYRVK